MSDPGRIPTVTRRDVGGIGLYFALPLIAIVAITAFMVLR